MQPPILYILNLSLSQGKVPLLMKKANVTPIYKGGDPKHLGNYRPISVLDVFSKLLEKMVSKGLRNFIEANNALYPKQFGFRTKYSTEMALLSAVDFITSSLDRKKHIIGLFLDLRKAFHTVDNNILLAKLYHYGV